MNLIKQIITNNFFLFQKQRKFFMAFRESLNQESSRSLWDLLVQAKVPYLIFWPDLCEYFLCNIPRKFPAV